MEKYINLVLLSAIISWLAAQIIKVVVYAIKFKTFNPERIVGAGGMPSSHSSTVCALVIAVSKAQGIASTEFALAMVLAMIVMYDATGVRRSAGLQAKEINRIRRIVDELDEEHVDKLEEKIEDESEKDSGEETKDLKEMLGHTPLEVLCGALLGIIIAMLIPIPYVG